MEKKAVKRKYAWMVLAIGAVVVLPLRLYESLFLLEPKTGFYSDGGKASLVTAVLMAVFAAAAAVIGVRGGQPLAVKYRVRSIPTAVCSAFAGALLLIVSAGGLVAPPQGDSSVIYRIFSASGIAAGVVFLMQSYGFSTGLSLLEKHPVAALLPSAWGCFGMMVLFVEFSAVVNSADNAYYTGTAIFLLLFLFSQAKMFTGVESEKSGKLIYAAGFPAVLLSLATSVPGIVLFAAGESGESILRIGLYAVNFLLACSIVFYLRALERVSGTGEQVSEDGPEPAVPADAGPEPHTEREEWILPAADETTGDAAPLIPQKAERNAAQADPETEHYAKAVLGSPELLSAEDSTALDSIVNFLRESAGDSEKFVEPRQSPFLPEEETAVS